MKVAVITPLKLLKEIQTREYHLVLAQWLDKSPEYRKFYQEQAVLKHSLVLDNGASEGESVSNLNLLLWAQTLRGLGGLVTMVAPDVLWDYRKTLKTSFQFMEMPGYRDWEGQTMLVPQGAPDSARDWLSCVKRMRHEDFDVWGITRGPDFAFSNRGGRIEFAKKVMELDMYSRPIHFLGIWTDAYEVYRMASDPILSPRVIGIDSKIFYKLSRDRVCLQTHGPVDYQRPEIRTDLENGVLDTQQLKLFHWNVWVADQWAQGHQPVKEYATWVK